MVHAPHHERDIEQVQWGHAQSAHDHGIVDPGTAREKELKMFTILLEFLVLSCRGNMRAQALHLSSKEDLCES